MTVRPFDKFRMTARASGSKDQTFYRESLDGARAKAIQMGHDDRGPHRSAVSEVHLEGRQWNSNRWISLSTYTPDHAASRGGPLHGTWTATDACIRHVTQQHLEANRLHAEADAIWMAATPPVFTPEGAR